MSYQELLFGCLYVVCGGTTVWVLISPRRVFEYPWFMTLVYTIFCLPQFVLLARHPYLATGGSESITGVLELSVLALASCWAGYFAFSFRAASRRLVLPVDPDRLFHVGVATVAVGLVCMLLAIVMATAQELDKYGNATGTITIVFTFMALGFTGAAICLTCHLRTRAWWTQIGFVIGLIMPLVTVLVNGRRFAASNLVAALALSMYFYNRRVPPRVLLAVVIPVSVLIMATIGSLRSELAEKGANAYLEFNPLTAYSESQLEKSENAEALMACHMFAYRKQGAEINLGAGYWNHIVFRFVPSQFVGRDLKEWLHLPVYDLIFLSAADYPPGAPPGTGASGIVDSYAEFGYAGPLVFLVMGCGFRLLWESSLNRNNLLVQLLYISLAPEAARGLILQSRDILPGLLFHLIFWFLFAAIYARETNMGRRLR